MGTSTQSIYLNANRFSRILKLSVVQKKDVKEILYSVIDAGLDVLEMGVKNIGK